MAIRVAVHTDICMEGILPTPACSWGKKGSLVLKHYSGPEAVGGTGNLLTQCCGEWG